MSEQDYRDASCLASVLEGACAEGGLDVLLLPGAGILRTKGEIPFAFVVTSGRGGYTRFPERALERVRGLVATLRDLDDSMAKEVYAALAPRAFDQLAIETLRAMKAEGDGLAPPPPAALQVGRDAPAPPASDQPSPRMVQAGHLCLVAATLALIGASQGDAEVVAAKLFVAALGGAFLGLLATMLWRAASDYRRAFWHTAYLLSSGAMLVLVVWSNFTPSEPVVVQASVATPASEPVNTVVDPPQAQWEADVDAFFARQENVAITENPFLYGELNSEIGRAQADAVSRGEDLSNEDLLVRARARLVARGLLEP